MAKGSKEANRSGKGSSEDKHVVETRSVKIARGGINNSRKFTDFFSALIADLSEQKVTASMANAMCNAGGKMLKMVELEIRYGQQIPGQSRRLLTIAAGE